MNDDTFNKIVTDRLEHCKTILTQKNKEYSSDVDRLHNFKVAARINDTTPEKALKGMWLKHIISIFDLIDDPDKVSLEILDDKMTDNINYTLLLEALFRENK